MNTQLIHDILDEAEKRTPQSEAQVSHWVIVPVLEALGYQKRDIVPQATDSHNQFPDYTVLPDTNHTWYVEVKDWCLSLADRFVNQALNYANQNGRRWVVLTNGRVWRLYDNHVRSAAAGKRVTEASVSERDALLALFAALTPASIEHELDRFAARERLRSYLTEHVAREDSDLVRTIQRFVRKQVGLESVTTADIVQSVTVTPSQPSQQAAVIEPRPAPVPKDGSVISTQPDIAAFVSLDSLTSDSGSRVTGARPQAAMLPDGAVRKISTWADLAQVSVEWLLQQSRMPTVPFFASDRAVKGKRSFVNTEPRHPDGTAMKGYRRAEGQGHALYVDTNRSATLMVASIHRLCQAAGEAPSGIRVLLESVPVSGK